MCHSGRVFSATTCIDGVHLVCATRAAAAQLLWWLQGLQLAALKHLGGVSYSQTRAQLVREPGCRVYVEMLQGVGLNGKVMGVAVHGLICAATQLSENHTTIHMLPHPRTRWAMLWHTCLRCCTAHVLHIGQGCF